MNTPRLKLFVCTTLLGLAGLVDKAHGQAEALPGGGLRGIRVDGELMPFATGIRAVEPGAALPADPSTERMMGAGNGGPRFTRTGNSQTIAGGLENSLLEYDYVYVDSALRQALSGNREAKAILDKYPNLSLIPGGPRPGGGRSATTSGLGATVTYTDTVPGTVKVDVQTTAATDTPLAGVYYFIHLSAKDYPNAVPHFPGQALGGGRFASATAKSVQFTTNNRQLSIEFSEPVIVTTLPDNFSPGGMTICFPVHSGNITASAPGNLSFTLTATGNVDKSPATLKLDPAHPGPAFAGMGGNFRLQSNADPAEVEYDLNYIRVAWGRVDFPLAQWQPQENGPTNPGAVARSFGMIKELADKHIPVILTLWGPPAWAVSDYVSRPAGGGGGQARHINPAKWDSLCAAIGTYLDYLKQNGVEPEYFSFNETDIGYDILQTPAEHAEAIKHLGAYFAAKGYKTRMFLGDTGDPTGINFINTAMADPEAVKYIGAVSYHSWRGGTDEQFIRWGNAAKKLGVPLFVGEGGMDSDAYRYQNLLLEPWYALIEITEYVDICRLSQPASILQWQLTENYSLLTHGPGGVLGPAQRFWQIRQLSLTPAGSAALPITTDKAALSPCAFLDPKSGAVTIHIANNGATRTARLTGLPASVKELQVYVTDAQRGLKPAGTVPVGPDAQITLDSMSLTTLTNVPNFNGQQ